MKSNVIPKEWVRAELQEFCNILSGNAFKSNDFVSDGVPVVKISNVQYCEYVEKNQEYLPSQYLNDYSEYNVSDDDLLIALTRPITNGKLKICRYPKNRNQGLLNQRVAKLTADKCLPESFILYQFRTEEFMKQVKAALSETLQPNLSPKSLAGFDCVLPPLAEQKVIADKLDTLLAQVENTKVRLERIPEILKSFRQSVLAAAVSGKLTEEWRISESKPDSSISVLPENNKTRRGLPESVALPDSLASFSFPEHWSLLSVASLLRKGVIIDLKDGNHGANHPKSSEFTQEGLPFITAAQMSDDGKIDYVGAPKVSGKPLEKLKVGFSEAEDVIYSHKGTVGRVGIADRASVLSPQTTYIRLNQKYVSNRYYALMLKSHAFTSQVDAIKSQTTRDFVPITAHYALFAVIPPIDEQTEIVRRVEELFAFADRIEQAAQAAQSRVNNLTQSILAKAFRGELTADWRIANPDLISGDNSAEALLAKIKAERAKVKTTKKD